MSMRKFILLLMIIWLILLIMQPQSLARLATLSLAEPSLPAAAAAPSVIASSQCPQPAAPDAICAHLPTPQTQFDARGVGRDQFFTLWKIERDSVLFNEGTIIHA